MTSGHQLGAMTDWCCLACTTSQLRQLAEPADAGRRKSFHDVVDNRLLVMFCTESSSCRAEATESTE